MDRIEIVKQGIPSYYAGGYRLEYDGKYITLFGKDNRYAVPSYGDYEGPVEYEEMVLVPVVLEVRNASPKIIKVNKKSIVIKIFTS